MYNKTPKVLEKRPIIAGYDLKTIVVLISCLLLFVFTLLRAGWMSIGFVFTALIFLRVKKRFPEKGQFRLFIAYVLGKQCIRMNRPLNLLINRREDLNDNQ